MLNGVDSSQLEKIYHWKCVGKGHGWRLNGTKQCVGEWNGAYWLFVCGYICAWITAVKRNGMTALICGVEWRSHLCRAVLRWEKWTERNVVKGGRVVRYELRPPKRNERREWTDRKHMKIKHDIFFPTATAEREEGNFVGFWLAVRLNNSPIRCFLLSALPLGAYSSGSVAGQSVDFVRLLYIIWL